jgi:hypothetical protein
MRSSLPSGSLHQYQPSLIGACVVQIMLRPPQPDRTGHLAPVFSGTDFNSLETTHTVRRCKLDLSWQRLSRFRCLPTVEYVPPRHAALPNLNDDLARKIKRQQLDVLFNPMWQFHQSPPFQYLSVGGLVLSQFISAVNQTLRHQFHQPFHGDHAGGSSGPAHWPLQPLRGTGDSP